MLEAAAIAEAKVIRRLKHHECEGVAETVEPLTPPADDRPRYHTAVDDMDYVVLLRIDRTDEEGPTVVGRWTPAQLSEPGWEKLVDTALGR